MSLEVSTKVNSALNNSIIHTVAGTQRHGSCQISGGGKVTLVACIVVVIFEYGLQELNSN